MTEGNKCRVNQLTASEAANNLYDLFFSYISFYAMKWQGMLSLLFSDFQR